jgi:PAS domain S-box-containing protein
VAAAVLVFAGFNRSQDDAAAKSREGLEREGISNLSRFTEQQAYVGELQLSPAAEWGHQAGAYLQSEGPAEPAIDPSSLGVSASGNRFDPSATRITDLEIPSWIPLSPDVLAEAGRIKALDSLFPALFTNYQGRLIQEPFRPIAIYYIAADGVTRYYPPNGALANSNLTAEEMASVHATYGPGANPDRKTVWTAPYEDEAGRGQVLTAYSPVYEGDTYRGVVGVDVSLALLTQQVEDIRPTPSGFAFYVDRTGEFLHTSQYDQLTKLAAPGANPAFRQALDGMLSGQAGVARVQIDGRESFVAYAPMTSVGGSLAFVAPADEMTAEAANVTQSIQSEGNRTVFIIVMLMAGLFGLALAATAWVNRRVLVGPIEALVSGTRAVAAGNFNASIPVHSRDELGDLAVSFNRMIEEIRTRNEALQREIIEREQTTNTLAEREESARQVFELVNDALFITDEKGAVVDANRTASRMYGYTLEEFRALPPFALTDASSPPQVDAYLGVMHTDQHFRRRSVGLRKDGSTFASEVFATGTMYLGKPSVLCIVRDVTEEADRQRLLEERVAARTKELSLLLEVSQTLSSSLDLNEVFARALDEVAQVVPFTRASLLVLEGNELVSRYARGPLVDGSEPLGPARFPIEGLRHSFRDLLGGHPLLVPDIRGESDTARDFRWLVGDLLDSTFASMVSWMALPMLHKGRFIGIMSLFSSKPGVFDESIARLGMGVASQAAVAFENARLFAESERRASEMLGLSRIATTLDLEQSLKATLDSVAQRIVESTSAVGCSVSTLTSDGMLLLGGQYGLPEGFLEAVDAGIHNGAPRPNMLALRSGEPAVIPNARTGTASIPAYAELHELIKDEPWNTLLVVPMHYGDRDLGTIETYHREEDGPDEREIGLIVAMARQAATAIENAFLFSQTEKRVRQLEALTEVASTFSLELSLEELMSRVAEEVVKATNAEAAVVSLADSADSPLSIIGTARLPEGFGEALEQSYRAGGGTTARQAMRELRTVYQDDLRRQRIDDPRYSAISPQLHQQPWDSILITPIVYGGSALGVLLLGYPLGVDPDDEERAFVEAVADQTGLVIQNSRLYQKASAAAALEERQRLARELHDSVSQALYGIALGARTARRRIGDDGPANVIEPLDYVLSLAEAGLTEMRALIFELRPESIATEGLVAAIGRQVASTQARYGIEVVADLCDEPEVSLDVKEALYRIAQESMHNTVKHARATELKVRLCQDAEGLELQVADNGQGFDASRDFPGHLGLRSMRERARNMGGSLEVDSGPGLGARVTIRVPLSGA